MLNNREIEGVLDVISRYLLDFERSLKFVSTNRTKEINLVVWIAIGSNANSLAT